MCLQTLSPTNGYYLVFYEWRMITLPTVVLLAPLPHSMPASIIQNNHLQSVSQFHRAGKSADQTKTGGFQMEAAGRGLSIGLS